MLLALNTAFLNKPFVQWHDSSVVTITFGEQLVGLPQSGESSKLASGHSQGFLKHVPVNVLIARRDGPRPLVGEIDDGIGDMVLESGLHVHRDRPGLVDLEVLEHLVLLLIVIDLEEN